MPKVCSEDLCWRVIWLHFFQNKSVKEISKQLYLSEGSIERYIHLFNRIGDIAPKISAMDPYQPCVNLKRSHSYKPHPAYICMKCKKSRPWYHRFILWLYYHILCYQEIRLVMKEDALCSFTAMWAKPGRIYIRILGVPTMLVFVDETGLDHRNSGQKVWLQPSWNDPCDPPACVYGKRMPAIGVLTTRGTEDSYLVAHTHIHTHDSYMQCHVHRPCTTPTYL